jgi:hypothetical protein
LVDPFGSKLPEIQYRGIFKKMPRQGIARLTMTITRDRPRPDGGGWSSGWMRSSSWPRHIMARPRFVNGGRCHSAPTRVPSIVQEKICRSGAP